MVRKEEAERGQAIIIVVFVAVILLTFAGLAIDGGTVYLGRRRMQNAADAGSLAGTRLLALASCGDSSINDLIIAAEVNAYAEENGVEDTNGVPGDAVNGNVSAQYVHFENNTVVPYDPPDIVGDGGPIPIGASGIQVTTGITYTTYLMGLVGQTQSNAAQNATAITGPPVVGGGILPIGIPLEVVNGLAASSDPNFILEMSRNCDSGTCTANYPGGGAQHRGWINPGYVWNRTEEERGFPRAQDRYRTIGASTLMSFMSNPPQTLFYSDCLWSEGCRTGDYIHCKPGQNQGVLNTECAGVTGQTVFVPIFDQIIEGWDNIPSPKPDNPPPAGQQFFYHIVGFTGVKINGCGTGTENHTINMTLETVVTGAGMPCPCTGTGFGESGACLYNTQALSLWE